MTQEFRDHVGAFTYQIVESAGEGTRMRVRGTFQRADTKNGNGRVYSEQLWNKVLGDKDLREALKARRMTGEVEHPDDGTTKLSRVSHVVTKLERNGKEVIGEAEILNTPAGLILQELFRAGVQVGISSRGSGTSVQREGVEYVNESDFRLKTFDFVADPSTPGAFPSVSESLKGPYREDAPMSNKIDELRRLYVRSGEIREALQHGNDESMLSNYLDELTEMREMANTLHAQLKDDERGGQEARDTLDRISEAKVKASTKLHAIYERQSTELETEIQENLEAPPKSSEKKGGNDEARANRGLLEKAQRQVRFWRKRSIELSESQDDEGSVWRSKYEAAVKLFSALTERFGNLGLNFADLEARHEVLGERHEAAVHLLSETVSRHERAQVLRAVREAIASDSRLARFESLLLGSQDLSEVQSHIVELSRALEGLQEAGGGVDENDDPFARLEAEDDSDSDDSDGEDDEKEESFNPKNFASFEESLDGDDEKALKSLFESPGDKIFESISQGSRNLTESRDPRVRVAGRVLNKRGWK